MTKINVPKQQLVEMISKIVKEEKQKLEEARILQERKIVGSILLSESILDKVREYAKKGLLTATIVSSLLASPNISAQDKDEINNIANGKEMLATSFPKEIKLDAINSTSTALTQEASYYEALTDLKQKAKQDVYDKYKIDPNKFEVRILKINLTDKQMTPDYNQNSYNTNLTANVILTVIPRG